MTLVSKSTRRGVGVAVVLTALLLGALSQAFAVEPATQPAPPQAAAATDSNVHPHATTDAHAHGPATDVQISAPSQVQPLMASSYQGQQVFRLYKAYFKREPDKGGFQYWVQKRTQGLPLHQISSEFSRSNEFRRTYGNLDNSSFLDLVYRNVMNRRPDAGGHRYWLDHLNRGMSRGLLMIQFSESREFKRITGTEAPAPDAPVPGKPGSPNPPSNESDVPSNVSARDWLISPWEPNPGDMSWQPSGNFRTFCEFSHIAYNDPIMAPGDPNWAHLHMFFGNTAVNHNSTYQSLRSTGDSTCDGGPLNRTGYWMPAVFDGQDRVVVPDYFELYYKGENTSNGSVAQRQNEIRNIQPYPNGLRMIAGAPDRAGSTWGWKCESGGDSATIPDCAPGERLTVWVRFPYCWDGKNLDSANHRSHMSYGTNNTWGPCPSSHPIHLPELTEFAHFESPSGSGQWYISSDYMNPSNPAPNGSSFHADWFGAWDNDIQNRWLQNCIHGMRNASNGNLCDGQQLRPARNYTGPTRIPGYTPGP